MADRFPSLEDFSEGQTEAKGEANFDLDPSASGADFLSREKAALGDDADQFASSTDNGNPSATVEDGDDDLLGGGGQVAEEGGQDFEFESSFPTIDTQNEGVAPGGTITGSNEPFLPGQPTSTYKPQVVDEDEPEVIKQWRERRDLALQDREEKSARRKDETVKDAQKAIDDFYENYNMKKDKTVAQTRKDAEEFLAGREDTAAGGTSWERIAKLVDLSGKGAKGGASGTGKEKFRELLLSLRKDEKAPGASGY